MIKDYSELAKMVCENFPEASISLQCVKWDYEAGEFIFKELDSDKSHVVSEEDIEKALPLFFEGLNDKWYFDYVSVPESEDDFNDTACDLDGLAIDTIMQIAIFGEIVYG